MAQGREYLLHISSDGTALGTKTEIALQSDLTINGGKSVNTTVYKNGQNASQNDAGQSLTLNVGIVSPAGVGLSRLLDLDESGEQGYFFVTNKVTGGLVYEGKCLVGIGAINTPVNGDATAAVTIGVQGKWTKGVAA